MKTLMNILGVTAVVLSIIAGIFSGSFMIFLTSAFLGGGLSGGLFFGIAAVLDGQESIIYEIQNLKNNHQLGISPLSSKRNCDKCGKKYGVDYSSCPYCGNRP